MTISFVAAIGTAWWLLLLLGWNGARLVQSTVATVNTNTESVYTVPSFTLSELSELSSTTRHRLRDTLATTGLLAITDTKNDDDDILRSTRTTALDGLCHCVERNELAFLAMENTDRRTITTTQRRSLATATIGGAPLPLPVSLRDVCGATTARAMEDVRDVVAERSTVFVAALDDLLQNNGSPTTIPPALLTTTHGVNYRSVQSIVNASTNLEHFHVYSRQYSTNTFEPNNNMVMNVHTDAGLFLSFVPGLSCTPSSRADQQGIIESDHLYVMVHGKLLKARFPTSFSVGILLGLGAEQWLTQNQLPLRATKHAVVMAPHTQRAWYGMMHLVPYDAILQHTPTRATFADLRNSLVLNSTNVHQKTFSGGHDNDAEQEPTRGSSPFIGCGSIIAAGDDAVTVVENDNSLFSAPRHRRRLAMAADASACDNTTNFYCWMTCLDIPNAEHAQDEINQNHSLYCLDPNVLLSDSLAAAEQKCESSSGVPGGAMSGACVGSWQPTAPGVPSQPVHVPSTTTANDSSFVPVESSTKQQPFCSGGTSMYMDGFHWKDSVCVIYLFPTWIISSAGALAGSCLATFVFALALEMVIKYRREFVSNLPVSYQRLGVSTLLYGVQLTMGYLIMLLVMTYSAPLFVCVVVGLMGGHVVSNLSLARAAATTVSPTVVRTAGACACAGAAASEPMRVVDKDDASVEVVSTDGQTVGECPCGGGDNTGRPCLPWKGDRANNQFYLSEGSTPCCQNYVEYKTSQS